MRKSPAQDAHAGLDRLEIGVGTPQVRHTRACARLYKPVPSNKFEPGTTLDVVIRSASR